MNPPNVIVGLSEFKPWVIQIDASTPLMSVFVDPTQGMNFVNSVQVLLDKLHHLRVGVLGTGRESVGGRG